MYRSIDAQTLGKNLSKVFFIVLYAFLYLWFSSVGQAQTFDDRNFAKGIDPGQYYQSFGADNVNILNGNLTLSIPIGGELKHNGNLSLQLALRYNSTIYSEEIKPRDGSSRTSDNTRVAYLDGRSPAGVGFQLHLGHVYANLVDSECWWFEGPDGSTHRIFNTGELIHNGEIWEEIWETRDYTFIRAIPIKPLGAVTGWKIYMPSGSIYTLEHYIPYTDDSWYTNCDDPCSHNDDVYKSHDKYQGYYVSKIEDRHGNEIVVKYRSEPPINQPNQFACMASITFVGIGSGNNARKITFEAVDEWDNLPYYGGLITSISVPKYGGYATYGLTYQTVGVDGYITYPKAPLPADEEHRYEGYGPGWSSYRYYNMPCLKTISLPEGNMTIGMEYNGHGELETITYPSGKKVQYLYDHFDFSSYYHYKWSFNPDRHLNFVRGVGARNLFDGSTKMASWGYERASQSLGYTTHPAWVKVTATKPQGDVDDYFLTRYDYGHSVVQSTGHGINCDDGLVKTVRIYSGENENRQYLLKRTDNDYTYFYYDSSGGGHGGSAHFVDTNSYRTTTSWPLGSSEYIRIKETKENYQDFGHYEKTTVTESNTDTGGFTQLKATSTDWGDLVRNTSNPEYRKWLLSMPEFTTTYTGAYGGDVCSKVVYTTYDANTGELLREDRARAVDGNENPTDSNKIEYVYNSVGNLDEIKYNTNEYILDLWYSYGVMYSKKYRGVDWYLEYHDQDGIDSNSGLFKKSYGTDKNGYYISFSYDNLNRLTSAKPIDPHISNMYYTDLVYNDSWNAVTVKRMASSSSEYSHKSIVYDYNGNVIREKALMPPYVAGGSDYYAWYEKEYNRHGKMAKEYVAGKGAIGTEYTTIKYDSLGRIDEIVTPNSPSDIPTKYTYDGLSETVVTPIQASNNNSKVVTISDGIGRVTEVIEYLYDRYGAPVCEGEDCVEMQTKYKYDGMDRLIEVDQSDPSDVHHVVELRKYTYDLEGNIVKSEEPDSGVIKYLDYDGLGNVKEVVDGTNNPAIKYRYDSAGRLIQIDTKINNTYKVLTNYTYDVDYTGAGNRPVEGKLTKAVEHDHFRVGLQWYDNKHTQVFEYGEWEDHGWGKCGALSEVYTRVDFHTKNASGVHEPQYLVWWTYYNWDKNGDLRNIDYPNPVAHMMPGVYVNFGITYQYDKGMIKDINRWNDPLVKNVTYFPDSGLKGYETTAGTDTLITPDSQWRPSRIQVNSPSGYLFKSGLYGYGDGLGRITTIGPGQYGAVSLNSETYYYDSLSRLTQAFIRDKENTGHQLDYAYDIAGNMRDRLDLNSTLTNYPRYSGYQYTNGAPGASPITNRLDGHGAVYDNRGNMTEYVNPSNSNTVYMQYDAKRRISRSSENSASYRTKYLYDHNDRRIMKGDTESGVFRFYLRDPVQGNLLSEYYFKKAPGDTNYTYNWRRHYVHLGRKLVHTEGMPENVGLPMFGAMGGGLLTHKRFYHHNHLDSPVVVTDNMGNLKTTHKYTPFGFELPSIVQDRGEGFVRFTGHERDGINGIDYMFKRYYSQHLCRFLSTDPVGGDIGSSQSWNKYVYVNNDPINRVDPTGMTDEQAIIAMNSLNDMDVLVGFAVALENAGYDASAVGIMNGASREATGGVAELLSGGSRSGDFTAYSEVKPGATVASTPLATVGEIQANTGGVAVASLHTHQLAGKKAGLPPGISPQRNGPSGSRGGKISKPSADFSAIQKSGVPGFVVTPNAVHLVWEDNNGQMQSAVVVKHAGPGALKGGDVDIEEPEQLEGGE